MYNLIKIFKNNQLLSKLLSKFRKKFDLLKSMFLKRIWFLSFIVIL